MRVLITCGPTWVPIDDVRVISNTSSGQMGHLIAQECKKVKAQVTLIEGQVTHAWDAQGVRVIKYRFFDELAQVFKAELRKKYDVVIHAAAVSDFKVAKPAKVKISSSQGLVLKLEPTEKLINAVKAISPESLLVGFKLEDKINSQATKEGIRRLFTDSGCDLVVANSLIKGYQGLLIDADGNILAKAQSRLILAQRLVRLLK